MIEQNGISVNAIKENDINKVITTKDFKNGELIIRKGKKQFKNIYLYNSRGRKDNRNKWNCFLGGWATCR